MFLLFSLSLSLSLILIFINSSLAKKSPLEREKPSPFECGFLLFTPSRLTFSLRFFLIAVIFLIFDVEITLILPLPILLNNTLLSWVSPTSWFFISILLLGLYHEWMEGSLQWK